MSTVGLSRSKVGGTRARTARWSSFFSVTLVARGASGLNEEGDVAVDRLVDQAGRGRGGRWGAGRIRHASCCLLADRPSPCYTSSGVGMGGWRTSGAGCGLAGLFDEAHRPCALKAPSPPPQRARIPVQDVGGLPPRQAAGQRSQDDLLARIMREE